MKTNMLPLENFRKAIYSILPKRRDAIMNLLDAVCSYGHQCKSVVELSNAECFERQYSSITDAIADGLCDVDWDEVEKTVFESSQTTRENKPVCFITDCSSHPRQFSDKLADRTVTHAPNPAPGNKPICVGHQYSVVTVLPTQAKARAKHWLVPMSAQRVESHSKGNEVGMEQIIHCMDKLQLTDELTFSVGDSLYGTENCRKIASEQKNLVHIFRLNSTRNLFFKPLDDTHPQHKKGRKKEYGDKFTLNNVSTHKPCHQQTTTSWTSARGNKYKVTIKLWPDMLLRGSNQFRSSQHPINLIQVCVTDSNNNPVFKRPLWLGVFGQQRHKIDLTDVYDYYKARYDIEHFFRFGKSKLLLTSYQTPDVNHEEAWWKLGLLAYAQLLLANELVPILPQPWERYLPEYKLAPLENNKIATPTQTQRGFDNLLKTIGTPAKACVPRGKPQGRNLGEACHARQTQPVIFKNKNISKTKNKINRDSEKVTNFSNPEKIDDLLKLVRNQLSQLQISPDKFSEMLINSS